jgi:hypothetical protein
VKGAVAIEQSFTTGGGAGKLDRRFDTLASRARKESFIQFAAGKPAETPGKFAREVRNVALEHRRTSPVKFTVQRFDDRGMVMSGIVNAVAGEEIENYFAFGGMQFRAGTLRVLRPHLKQVQQANPLRIDVIDVTLRG